MSEEEAMTIFPKPFPKIPAYRGSADLLHSVRRVVCMEKIDGANMRIGVPLGATSAEDILIGGRTLMEGDPEFQQEMLGPLVREDDALVTALLELAARWEAPLTLYGEACGSSIQRMGHIYGLALHVVLFAARLGEVWLAPMRSPHPKWPTLGQVASRTKLSMAPVVYEGAPDEERIRDVVIQASPHAAARGTQRPAEQMLQEGVVIWADPMLCRPDGSPLVAKLKHPSRQEYHAPDASGDVTPEDFARRCVTRERVMHAREHLRERGRWEQAEPDWERLARRVIQDVAREVEEYQDLLKTHGKSAVRDALRAVAMEVGPEHLA